VKQIVSFDPDLTAGSRFTSDVKAEITTIAASGTATVTAANITDATTVGRAVLTAVDAAAARAAIGAGTASTKADVGLGSVDNTPDISKPVSTAMQAALDGKVSTTSNTVRLYGTDGTGAQTTRVYGTAASANTIPQRTATGQVKTASPVADDDSSTKKYVDDGLATKAAVSHTHLWAELTDKPSTFPPSTHSHVVADVTGLQGALDAKVDTADPRLTDARTPTTHTHTISQITSLQTSLDTKANLWNGAIANDYLYMSPESSKAIEIPYYMNDIAYNTQRGGAARLYVDGVQSGTSLDICFEPTAAARSLPVSGVTEYVVEVDLWRTFTYGTKVGLALNESWRAKYLKIEAWDVATAGWKLCHEDTNNPTGDLLVTVPGNAAQGITKLRYTFRDFNSSQSMRIGQLILINYSSEMGAALFLPRGGGEVYGHISGITPTSAAHLTRKDYVDSAVAAKVDTTSLAVPKQAQANLTGSGLPALTGVVNGTNKVFTVPDGTFNAGTVTVFLNGVLQVPGEAVTWNTSTGAITFVDAPVTGDQIFVAYQLGGNGGIAPVNSKGHIVHGSNANLARPTGYASVEWIGTVAPVNAVANDTWVDIS